jgi:hypothetical protein
MASPSVGSQLYRVVVAGGLEQDVSQPFCVVPSNVEALAKNPSLVPAPRMRRIQAISLEFSNIED